MIMWRTAPAIALAIATLSMAGPARAIDPNGADILGLRLGMSASEVVDRLAHQGYPAILSPDAIKAKTLDGRLEALMSSEYGVTQITYVFSGRGGGIAAKISEAVLVRFGDPYQATPPAWCLGAGHSGMCSDDQASLTFLPDKLTLILRANAARRK